MTTNPGPTRAPRHRVWPGRIARLLSGALVLALAGGAVALASTLPEATGTGTAASASAVEVAPSASTLVCPGPLTLPDDSTSGGTEFDRVPVDPVEAVRGFTTQSGSDAALTLLDDSRTVDLKGTSASLSSPTTATVLRADPVDGDVARMAGVTSSVVTDGDLRGLSAASCTEPTTDVWLVGGSTALESTADLVVVNAGATAAEVTIELWGPSGAVDLGTGGSLVVAAGAQEEVVLAGIAAEQRRIVVHLSSEGGQIAGYLQDSLLDGFTPLGTDLVTAGSEPSVQQVVPGIVLGETDVDAADAGALRLLVPGDEDATVSVTLIGPDGEQPLTGAQDLELTAGEVTDISLGGLPAGSYTAVVDSTVAVAASAMTARAGEAGELDDVDRVDRAWSAATDTGGGLVAVPSGATSQLVLAAVPSDDATSSDDDVLQATVRTYGTAGLLDESTVEIPVGSTLTTDLSDLGSGITGVEVEPVDTGGTALAALSWALVASASASDGTLLSVVLPLVDRTSTTQALVREGNRVGLD
ncbi:MAG TPA: DUF5719 family protein [Cellulomonas sp.]